MTAPAVTVNLSATLSSTAGTIAIGDLLVPISGLYVKATAANVATAGVRAHGIALTPWSSNVTPGSVQLQAVGIVDTTTSGLGAGAGSWVRVSAAGRAERIATPSGSDDVIGWVETDGTFRALFGLLTPAIVNGGGGGFTAGGDLTGTSTSQTVAKVNGASVPAAGALTTGNSAYASGASALTYSALNLAGGAGWVSGTLPVGNGGTGITSLGAGVATFLGTPSGANLGSALTSALALAKVASPTGTGLAKVSGAAWSAAAATLVDADVSASAAIAVTKLAPSGTNNFYLKTVAGVPTWAAGGGGASSAGATSGQVQTGDGVGGFLAPTNVLAGAGFLSSGATPATTREIRLGGTGAVAARNAGNTADLDLVRTDGTFIYLGDSGRNDSGCYIYSGGDFIVNPLMHAVGGLVLTLACIGDASPYSVHGGTIITPASNAFVTLASTDYCFDWIEVVKGAWTGSQGIVLPLPASKAQGYYKTVVNTSTFLMNVSCSTGTTRNLATGLGQRFWVDQLGVRFAGPTFTP